MELLLRNGKYLRISCSRFSRRKIKTGKNQPPEKCLAINNDHYKRQRKCFPLSDNKVLIRAIKAKLSALLGSQYSPIYLDSGVYFTSMFDIHVCVFQDAVCISFLSFFCRKYNCNETLLKSQTLSAYSGAQENTSCGHMGNTENDFKSERSKQDTEGQVTRLGPSSAAGHLPSVNEAYEGEV